MSASAPQQQGGGPYRPRNWALGGRPQRDVDLPITGVFLALFIIGAAIHMTIFQLNRRRGHKFVFSALLFGFCMARITTTVMRIASVSLPSNLNLAIAAQVFVAAGVLLVFIINLLFAQRIVRAQHPRWGWSKAFKIFLLAHYVLIGLTLVSTITATVQSFFTLNPETLHIDRALQLYGASYFMYISFLPIVLVGISLALPRKQRVDKFGTGRFRTKIAILLTASTLACFGAAYRAGTSYRAPVPQTQPLPSYFHKAAFYMVNFGVEIIIVYMYAILRFDLRFHVPNGAKGSYKTTEEEKNNDDTPTVYTEEEAFEDSKPESKDMSFDAVTP